MKENYEALKAKIDKVVQDTKEASLEDYRKEAIDKIG